MKTDQDLLNTRHNEIFTVNTSQTAYQALVLMAERNVGALLKMEKQKLVRVISERDYARKVVLQGHPPWKRRSKKS
jgi:predicted transcriptional regulator